MNHSLLIGHEGRENGVAIAANPNTLANEVVTGKLAEQIIWGKGTLTLPKKEGGADMLTPYIYGSVVAFLRKIVCI